MELRNINTFLHIAELHSFSRTARQLGYSQSAVSAGSRAGRTAVRPRGQDRAAHRCGPDLFRLCTHPAGHGAAGAGCPAARPADQRQSAHRAGGFGVLHLPAWSAQTLPRPVPAGGAGAVHRHCRRDAADAGHKSDRSSLYAGPAPAAAQSGACGGCAGAGVFYCTVRSPACRAGNRYAGRAAPAGISAH